MPTCKALWKEAKKKNPPRMKEKDYLIMAISASAGAAASVLLSRIDWIKNPISKFPPLDFFIYAVIVGFMSVGIIYLFFKILEYWATFWTFVGLFWRKKKV